MRECSWLRLALVAVSIAVGTAHCSTSAANAGPGDAGPDGAVVGEGGGDDGPLDLPPPVDHRPVATQCDTTRPPGIDSDAGGTGFGCTNDSQCADAGTNGRCTPSGHNAGPLCTADACATDADCGAGKVCECGASLGAGQGRFANTCLPGDCRVDADCGAGGYCSPTWDTTCGSYNGIVGYYCHTPSDDCTSDTQCVDAGGPGYCAWGATVSKWICAYGFCAG
ncbi:MAG TPA: hypothetical protein VIF09_20775 [Polyangiaceae bacterium]|jgi:hypothetical protein